MEWRETGDKPSEASGEARDPMRPCWNPNSRDGIWSGLPGIEDIDDDDLEPLEDLEPGEEDERARWWQAHAYRWDDPDYRRGIDVVPPELRPAPFRPEVAGRVPDWGTKGEKTSGAVDLGDDVIDLVSGYDGPSKDLPRPRPGMNLVTMAHVEAHGVAAMKRRGVHEATLYINQVPCDPRNGQGCERLLSFMLSPGDKLTVYAEGGYVRVFRGKSDEDRSR